MGIVERKEREKHEMRQRIIDAAMHMFLEEGYEKTSIRNIAEAIEYSPATIYLYYKDKDELLYEVQREAFTTLNAVFKKNATHKDPFKRLEQLAYTYVKFGKENPQLYDLMFIIRAPMNVVENEEMWTNGHDAFGFLMTCIEECMAKDLLRFDDPGIAALSMWSMVHGLVSLDLRCRMKVMESSDEEVQQSIMSCIKTYLSMIKK